MKKGRQAIDDRSTWTKPLLSSTSYTTYL